MTEPPRRPPLVFYEPVIFAIERWSICQHCTEAIELRKVLGWIHCQYFYSCELQPGKKKGEHLFANPAD